MADYRRIVPRFWTDVRVAGDFLKGIAPMTSDQKVVFNFAITNHLACKSETGIYEISRGELSANSGVEMEKVHEILHFFNTDPHRKSLMEYDDDRHIVFIKSFPKYNWPNWLTTSLQICDAVVKDRKRPELEDHKFWREFASLNLRELVEARKGLDPTKHMKLIAEMEGLISLGRDWLPAIITPISVAQVQEKKEPKITNSAKPISIEKMKEVLVKLDFQI